jgi:hypothetical protein
VVPKPFLPAAAGKALAEPVLQSCSKVALSACRQVRPGPTPAGYRTDWAPLPLATPPHTTPLHTR